MEYNVRLNQREWNAVLHAVAKEHRNIRKRKMRPSEMAMSLSEISSVHSKITEQLLEENERVAIEGS